MRSLWLVPIVSCAAACGVPMGVDSAPERPDDLDFAPPTEPAPTGSKWAVDDETDACGRTERRWVLVDEVCAGTDEPDYLSHFRTPMFRDGVRLGATLYAVDGTHVWSIDTETFERTAIGAFPGTPLAAAAHGGRLLVAAADGGLLMLDVRATRPRVIDRLELDGPAMGIRVDDDVAWVAIGAAGIAAVELTKSGFGRHEVTAIPHGSFAAAAQLVDGRRAVVAACDRLAIVDPISGELLGQQWFDESLDIPARDVAVVGDVAFVAAGDTGVVAIDISEPKRARIIGNCRVDADGYYASGLRSDGKHLYVAAGEWGVQVIDVRDPLRACVGTQIHADPAPAQVCEDVPPWELVDWRVAYEPPPPARDPIAVNIDDGRIYAFGDARRNGLRAVDVWDANAIGDDPDPLSNDWLTRLGRYEEPHLVDRIVANGNRVVLTGQDAGIFRRDDAALLVRMARPHYLADAAAVELLDDGRLVAITHAGELFVEGSTEPIATDLAVFAPQLVQDADAVYVTTQFGIQRIALDGVTEAAPAIASAELPPTLAQHDGRLVVAAPEWTAARYLGDEPLTPHGVFDERQILDPGQWRARIPRRLLASSGPGLLELATLGQRAGLVRHGAQIATLELPAGTYAAMAANDATAYIVRHDRSLYRSELLVVDVEATPPRVLRTHAFTGVGTSVAATADRLYVGDADDGVMVFDLADPRSPAPLGLVALEAPHATF